MILQSLEKFLNDESVIEININANKNVFIHTSTGNIIKTTISSQEASKSFKLIADENNKVINARNPSVSGIIKDYSARIQILQPPIVDDFCASIRFPNRTIIALSIFVENNIMTHTQQQYLKKSVKNKKNILIGGSTSSGKTTLANSLINELKDSEERIYIIEDTRELSCGAENTVQILTNIDYTTREAVHDSLRMAPDRIFVGEVRTGYDIIELLSAWNTGHDGGITTIHCTSARNITDRIKQLCLQRNIAIDNSFIAETIDVVVFIEKNNEGRKVRDILEITSYDKENIKVKKIH